MNEKEEMEKLAKQVVDELPYRTYKPDARALMPNRKRFKGETQSAYKARLKREDERDLELQTRPPTEFGRRLPLIKDEE